MLDIAVFLLLSHTVRIYQSKNFYKYNYAQDDPLFAVKQRVYDNMIIDGDKIYNRLGRNMRNIKISGNQLAEKYGISKSACYRLLSGKNIDVSKNIKDKILNEYDNFKTKHNNIVKIDKDFCKLIGFYVAEGSNTGSGISFAFHSKEVDYHNFVLKAMKKIFNLTGYKRTIGNKCEICFMSYEFYDISYIFAERGFSSPKDGHYKSFFFCL